jgi:hypothetical protein
MKFKISKIQILLVPLLAVGLASCAVTDFDRTANFSVYKTFSWGTADVKVENPVYESDLIHKNIKNTIEEEFAKRGIVKEKENPDFLVNYHTYTEKKEQISGRSYYGSPFFYPYGFVPFIYRWGWPLPYAYGMPQHYTYTEGTLIVDIFDTKSNEVVWRGTVAGKVDDVGNLQKQIDKGIRAIMKKYPVTPDSAPLLLEKKDNV